MTMYILPTELAEHFARLHDHISTLPEARAGLFEITDPDKSRTMSVRVTHVATRASNSAQPATLPLLGWAARQTPLSSLLALHGRATRPPLPQARMALASRQGNPSESHPGRTGPGPQSGMSGDEPHVADSEKGQRVPSGELEEGGIADDDLTELEDGGIADDDLTELEDGGIADDDLAELATRPPDSASAQHRASNTPDPVPPYQPDETSLPPTETAEEYPTDPPGLEGHDDSIEQSTHTALPVEDAALPVEDAAPPVEDADPPVEDAAPQLTTTVSNNNRRKERRRREREEAMARPQAGKRRREDTDRLDPSARPPKRLRSTTSVEDGFEADSELSPLESEADGSQSDDGEPDGVEVELEPAPEPRDSSSGSSISQCEPDLDPKNPDGAPAMSKAGGKGEPLVQDEALRWLTRQMSDPTSKTKPSVTDHAKARAHRRRMVGLALRVGNVESMQCWQDIYRQWRVEKSMASAGIGSRMDEPTGNLVSGATPRAKGQSMVAAFRKAYHAYLRSEASGLFENIRHRVTLAQLAETYQELYEGIHLKGSDAQDVGEEDAVVRRGRRRRRGVDGRVEDGAWQGVGQGLDTRKKTFLFFSIYPEWKSYTLTPMKHDMTKAAYRKLDKLNYYGKRWLTIQQELGMGVLSLLPPSVTNRFVEQDLKPPELPLWIELIRTFNPQCIRLGEAVLVGLQLALNGSTPSSKTLPLERVTEDQLGQRTDFCDLFDETDGWEMDDGEVEGSPLLPAPTDFALAQPVGQRFGWGPWDAGRSITQQVNDIPDLDPTFYFDDEQLFIGV